MNIKFNSLRLMGYYVLSLFYFEVVFKTLTIGQISTDDILLTSLFVLFYASVFYLITSLFNQTWQLRVSLLLLSVMTLIFGSQFIYYKVFGTLYSTYSLLNAGQITQFISLIVEIIIKHFGGILLFLAPLTGHVLLRKWLVPIKGYRTMLLLIAGCQLFAVLTIGRLGKEVGSAYDTYYHTNSPIVSLQKFGLVTTMRIDVQRRLTGWSPTLMEVEAPEPTPDDFVPPIHIDYNMIDFNFDELIKNETDPDIIELHQYFKNLTPSKKNQYTGMYQGYNLIFITAESFSHLAIDRELTPTLYKMANEGIRFPNFYTPVWEVSTSDGEYVAATGLIPKSGVWSFYESSTNALPYVMGNQLKNLGYTTKAYHNNSYTYYHRNLSHPNMGYDYKGVGNGLFVDNTWPESDLEMLQVSLPEYIDAQPFHTYYMTVSGHMFYTFNGNAMATKHRDAVKDLPYSEGPRAYLASQIEFDKAMEYLLNELEAKGITDKTLIVISSDHYPYGLETSEISELTGHPVEENFELYENALIIYAKGMEPLRIDRPASSLDILPTISNLLGLEYDSRLLMGQDLLGDEEPLTFFLNRSFITDHGRYNSVTGESENLTKDEVTRLSNIINQKFYYSAKILETDYYRTLK